MPGGPYRDGDLRAAVAMSCGTELTIGPGALFSIPPGHDSWVIGREEYVSLHFLGAEKYARSLAPQAVAKESASRRAPRAS